MSHKSRIEKLEAQQHGAGNATPQTIEVWGTREDGTRYLIQSWRDLVYCTSHITDQDGNPLDIEHERGLSTLGDALREIAGGPA